MNELTPLQELMKFVIEEFGTEYEIMGKIAELMIMEENLTHRWIKVGDEIPLHRMLWLLYDGTWTAGNFVDDSDYGLCVRSDEEEYILIEKISHYMIIKP